MTCVDVAQENISPVVTSQLSELFNYHALISRFFVDLEQDAATGLSRLLPSEELEDAYPEDDAWGASFIRETSYVPSVQMF